MQGRRRLLQPIVRYCDLKTNPLFLTSCNQEVLTDNVRSEPQDIQLPEPGIFGYLDAELLDTAEILNVHGVLPICMLVFRFINME